VRPSLETTQPRATGLTRFTTRSFAATPNGSCDPCDDGICVGPFRLALFDSCSFQVSTRRESLFLVSLTLLKKLDPVDRLVSFFRVVTLAHEVIGGQDLADWAVAQL
jgi:hypothetical protein